ncbi:MAG: Rrf2 family transcriptional regulator, partial [Atopobiaceae bacterium]|nr:Rrf2 family transcriptional regulator [Atopobiaceae bacterium]
MISTKGRYALRVLIDLADQGAGARVPLKDIAARQGISEKYLQHIVRT